ncbi:MAG: chorismate synthase [Oscillospiraceae bacterium]|nr:chorismate synthase [Oscillospiraceae bacterium]
MKSVIGTNITLSLYGESHGAAIGAVVDGLPAGIKIDTDFISSQLDKRRPKGKISTQRREGDEFVITSGVFNGFSTGTPVHIMIENKTQRSGDYQPQLPRPGHADYAAHIKYGGFEDWRGGGHFSGRLTAPVVAAGAVAISILAGKGISIGTHIKKCQHIEDRSFENYAEDIALCNTEYFATLDKNAGTAMQQHIESIGADGDSVGGVLETCVLGLPAGVGEPYFNSIESVLSQWLFSIGGVKGVEFGLGFGFADCPGSEVNDAFEVKGGKVVTKTNHNGGINGGISNGMPVIFRVAVKPTPSIFKEQDTVNLETMENAKLSLKGRHDPAIFHRARVVVDSMTALALLDLLVRRYGERWLTE